MMRPANDLPEVYLCLQPVDFRKGMIALAVMVERELKMNPFDARLFVFTNRHRNQVRILYWERNGFCLWQKRLEKERFHWLRSGDGGATAIIGGHQLNWLLDGYDIARMKPHKEVKFSFIS
ncbi:MAG: IS66 family insertion sequence element accessory protein TnpB [Magnetococcales bacterium]|nr:IS66 family insertion sequence element accessory protein TnpB [Magnetococcales bacterium]